MAGQGYKGYSTNYGRPLLHCNQDKIVINNYNKVYWYPFPFHPVNKVNYCDSGSTSSTFMPGLQPLYGQATIMFPSLRAFCCNWYNCLPSYVIENAIRLGIHCIGWEGNDDGAEGQKLGQPLGTFEYYEMHAKRY
jgi:hypothetical protein